MKKYSDISGILKKKEEHRRTLGALSFEQKIEMVFKIQARREFLKSGEPASQKHKPKVNKR